MVNIMVNIMVGKYTMFTGRRVKNKSWVSFAEGPYKRDDILQKRPIFIDGQVTNVYSRKCGYGVATVSRMDKLTGLFCRISSLL